MAGLYVLHVVVNEHYDTIKASEKKLWRKVNGNLYWGFPESAAFPDGPDSVSSDDHLSMMRQTPSSPGGWQCDENLVGEFMDILPHLFPVKDGMEVWYDGDRTFCSTWALYDVRLVTFELLNDLARSEGRRRIELDGGEQIFMNEDLLYQIDGSFSDEFNLSTGYGESKITSDYDEAIDAMNSMNSKSNCEIAGITVYQVRGYIGTM